MMKRMTKAVLAKSLRMARGTATMMGMAVIVALMLGIGTTALAAVPGDPFKLGRLNSVDQISRLIGSTPDTMLRIDNDGSGNALDLRVEPGEAPMTVDSTTKVDDLNADELDGKSAGELGVNGLEQVTATSALNSSSGKSASATCPAEKVVVGTGYNINLGKSGAFPNEETDVVIDAVFPNPTNVVVNAFEEESTGANWSVTARAICATAP